MPYCGHRSVEYHTRASPSHYIAYLGTHSRLVAMYGTLLARRLPVTETAPVKTGMRILQKFTMLLVNTAKPQFVTAVKFHHSAHNTFLAFYSVNFHPNTTTTFSQPAQM